MLSQLKRIYRSIAFLPFLIAFGFGALAAILVAFPVQVKGTVFEFLAITNKGSVETIITFVVTGIFTLTVFSYTMVMNVLNRSISNFSPRLIPLLLSQRNHKLILGVTSGTIVYGLVLALFVSNDTEKSFPDLAASLALFFAVICVGLFIYFLHTVSQSIHINFVLEESFQNTRSNIQRNLDQQDQLQLLKEPENWAHSIPSKKCGYLQQVNLAYLAKLGAENNLSFKIHPLMGSFVLEGQPLFSVSEKPSSQLEKKFWRAMEVDLSESMDVPEIGFKHLVEVAIKASSPAINDPGTSLTAVDYLTQLFVLYSKLKEYNSYQDKSGGKIYFQKPEFNKLLYLCFAEMKRYMKDDPILCIKLKNSLETIHSKCTYIKIPNYSDF